MTSLKGLLFSQFATEGLNNLIAAMQSKYKPKKGRRFNHDNITYEISRPVLKDNSIEFEVSSKIPENEVENPDEMKNYFEEIKKLLNNASLPPASIEMENIVWDSKKETEKERDYVKCLYRYTLDDLFDTQTVMKQHEEKTASGNVADIPDTPSAFTTQGKLVLQMVREKIQNMGSENIEQLIQANDRVRSAISK